MSDEVSMLGDSNFAIDEEHYEVYFSESKSGVNFSDTSLELLIVRVMTTTFELQ